MKLHAHHEELQNIWTKWHYLYEEAGLMMPWKRVAFNVFYDYLNIILYNLQNHIWRSFFSLSTEATFQSCGHLAKADIYNTWRMPGNWIWSIFHESDWQKIYSANPIHGTFSAAESRNVVNIACLLLFDPADPDPTKGQKTGWVTTVNGENGECTTFTLSCIIQVKKQV